MGREQTDFGKMKTFRCLCGAYCYRRLRKAPGRCKLCGGGLAGKPFSIDDVAVNATHGLPRAGGRDPKFG